MKAVVQIIDNAAVSVDGSLVGSADKGLFVLLGVSKNDTEVQAELLARKVCGLRIFRDENDKMNKSITDIGGSMLVVSNFTLCADVKKGNRPSFTGAMEPICADRLYEYFIESVKSNGVDRVGHGQFGADMHISAELSGPVTILLDTDIWSTVK